MISTIITIGDKITLTKLHNNDEYNSDKKQYVSSIQDVNEEEFIHIGMPSYNGQIVPLQIEEKFQLCIYTKRGLYQCSGMVIDRYREGAVHYAILRILSDLVRDQRRQFYRLDKIMDIEHCLFQEETDLSEPIVYSWKKAVMTDISGGGARFNSDVRYDTGDMVVIKMEIPRQNENQEFMLKARLISSQKLINQIGSYENRVEFSEIELSQREAIIRFIFEEERKLRRREKGLV